MKPHKICSKIFVCWMLSWMKYDLNGMISWSVELNMIWIEWYVEQLNRILFEWNDEFSHVAQPRWMECDLNVIMDWAALNRIRFDVMITWPPFLSNVGGLVLVLSAGDSSLHMPLMSIRTLYILKIALIPLLKKI